ncbi:MAG: HNH endonuclease signature motif containing protein [Gallionellaceae bacterium]|jgi:hypothetical protein
MLSQQLLKRILSYDPETGIFTYLEKTAKRISIGKIAGCKTKNGYLVIKINGIRFRLHRLAFLYMTGNLPTNEVDHINHIKTDNRWANLRNATRIQNARNKSGAYKNNLSTGLIGSYKPKDKTKFRAMISVEGKVVHLGYFSNPLDANQAYIDAKNKYHI